MKQAHRLIVLLGAFTLSACGGGGSGSNTPPPPPMTYTIGGGVSGLTASSSVVLQDNGGNNLTVSSNGPFTFTQAVSSGAAYAVTVLTQPTAQACTVTSGSGSATANVTNVTVDCANAASVSVGTFPSDVQAQDFNVPIVTVTVCDASSKCANVQVMVDTGSSGLRLMASAVSSLNLTAEGDSATPGNDLFECAYYANGFTWGGVYTAAQIKIGAETASNVPIQVISPSTTTPPTNCINDSPGGNNPLDTPDDFSADGVLGVGVAAQDCGVACTATELYYYSCPTSGCAAGAMPSTVATVGDEVANPVTGFTTDNNGLILQLPSIGASGAASASGLLIFGVGTAADNGVGSATILPTSGTQPQDINTSFNGQQVDGLIDSGSNAVFLPDTSPTPTLMPPCAISGTKFYCPTSPQTFSATNTGGGDTSDVSFQVQSLDTLHTNNPNFYAFNDVAGPFPATNGTSYFDWGLPFFYGRSVYTLIEGAKVGSQTYANGAFAY